MRGKLHSIKVATRSGVAGHHKTSCPFWKPFGECSLVANLPCRYGLTEIQVPGLCPLRSGIITVRLIRSDEKQWDAIYRSEKNIQDGLAGARGEREC
jgi:hypothetical protein